MRVRSWLFVPGDSEKKLEKSRGSNADVLIFDLEDSVGPSNKAKARDLVAAHLRAIPKSERTSQLWVRVNPLDSGLTEADLQSIIPAEPDGIVMPKPDGPQDAAALSADISAKENASGFDTGQVQMMVIASETAKSAFTLGDYSEANIERLSAMTWGAEDLSSALGASSKFDADGKLSFTYQMVRSLTLLGAHAAELSAIDGVYTDFRDLDGLAESSRAARAEGFHGRLAIHPAQVDVINAAFTPDQAEIEHAQQVVAAFEAEPGAGVVAFDGKMLDIPHLKQAQKLLAAAQAT